MKISKKYDSKSGRSEVLAFDDGIITKGIAQCCSEDLDFVSESVGTSIAEYRAVSKMYYKKAMKEFDTIIHLMNRYKSTKASDIFYQQIEDLGIKYLQKAFELNEMCEETIKSKDKFYRKMEDLRSGKLSRMEFIENIGEMLDMGLKDAIDQGMVMDIPTEEQ